MGSKESKTYRPPIIQKEAWKDKKDNRKSNRPEHGMYRILINNLTNQELQEYSVNFNNLSQFQKYIEFFQWRERQDSIVNTKFLNHELTKQFCNTNYSARVYIQHIPVRLSDISDIPFPQNLYLLFSSLEGFDKLYHSVGYFAIKQDLICMDKDGRVKVWLHSDLSKCHPSGRSLDQVNGYRRQDALEAKMVDEIVRMVEENTEEDKPSITVTDFLRNAHKHKPLTFKSAKQQIINYAQQFDVQIPNYFESVIGIFDEKGSDNDEQSAQQLVQNTYSPTEQFHQQTQQAHQIIDNWQSHHMQALPEQYKATDKSNPEWFQQPQPLQAAEPHTQFYNAYQSQPQPQPNSYFKSITPIQIGSVNNSNFKVSFNYNSIPSKSGILQPMTPIVALGSPKYHQIKRMGSLQIEKWCQQQKTNTRMNMNDNLKNLLINEKLVYSDSTSTYQLDSQIAQDMFKYLNY